MNELIDQISYAITKLKSEKVKVEEIRMSAQGIEALRQETAEALVMPRRPGEALICQGEILGHRGIKAILFGIPVYQDDMFAPDFIYAGPRLNNGKTQES